MKASPQSLYYSGTSGLLLPVRNKLFYPDVFKDKSRLCFYGSMMNSIEVNSSFYKVPIQGTVAKWRNEVPDNFRFTFKLSREITHNKGLAFEPDEVRRFIRVIDAVGDKKGCLLVQFPPSVRIAQLRQLGLLMHVLREADPNADWNIAMEFRHTSLYKDEVFSLLDEHGIGLVIQDKSPAETPIMDSALPFVYLRFPWTRGELQGKL